VVNADEIRRLYNSDYAASYDARFLQSEPTAADTQYELQLLNSFLTPPTSWLDVACGTGYFLSRFHQIERVGLDLSSAMLDRAKTINPGVEFVQHDFREPIGIWADRFGLVSCMWYAYGYVETLRELSQLIENLAAWTAPTGRCFVPLADPDLLARTMIPYRLDTRHEGDIFITGILWTYAEDKERVHRHMVAPNLRYMVEQFELFFEQVEIISYPQVEPAIGRRPALVASRKRPCAVSTAAPA
jgi:SAM-dependent methyltransferase